MASDFKTLQQVVRAMAEHGSRPAVVEMTRDGRVDWDYARLTAESAAFARRLSAEGAGRGDRVALFAPPGPAWFAACLGALRSGRVIVPLDTQLGDDPLEHVLNDSRPAVLVANAEEAERIRGLDLASAPRLLPLDAGESGRNEAGADDAPADDEPDVEPSDTAVIFYTSGTTGPPKGVPLTHANMAHQLNVVAESGLFSADDRALLPLPLHHVYPLAVGTFVPFSVGAAIVLPALLTGPQLMRAVRDAEVTTIIGVPRLYRSLYDGICSHVQDLGFPGRQAIAFLLALSGVLRKRVGIQWGKQLLRPLHRRFGPTLRIVASGGSALDPALADRLEALGWQVVIGYGLTETSPLLTLNIDRRCGLDTVGRPIEGVELRIDRSSRGAKEEQDDDADAGGGADDPYGEVLARGPNVFSGYLNLPEESETSFTPDGWFKTGDRGRFDDNGCLVLGGRTSSLIVTESGENIPPETLEEAYGKHPLIQEIGVLQRGNKLVAVVVPDLDALGPGAASDLREQIGRAVAERAGTLPSYQRLSDFAVSREPLARTRLGKIRRHKLDAHFDRARGEEDGQAAAAGPMELDDMSDEDRALLDNDAARKTWDWLCKRYSDRRLTPGTNPQLELGIDSLEWIGLSLELREKTGVELTEAAIGGSESIRDLLRAVAEGAEGRTARDLAAPLDSPEEFLDQDDLRWIGPRGPLLRLIARPAYAMSRLVMRVYLRLKVEGLEHVPEEGPYILAPNHRSYLDAPAVGDALGFRRAKDVNWAGAARIMLSSPVMRLVSRLARVAPVDAERAAISSLAFGAYILKHGNAVAWFPEGRMSRSGELERLQPGIGMLADRYETPIVPVWIEGTREALPPGRHWPRPGRLRVRFGKPLDPRRLREEGTGETPHQRITNALRERMIALAGGSDAG